MEFSIGAILQQLILPPGGFIFLSIVGLVLMRRFQRIGFYMTVSGVALLFLASLPIVAGALMSWLEPESSVIGKVSSNISDQVHKPPQAIVILGAGRRSDAPEFGGDTPNALALERIRYGVWLARRTLLPVLVSGGLGDDEAPSEAEMMKQLIEGEYALPVRWAETLSHNTHENAKYSAEMLKADGIESVYLVTHAMHMKRSVMSFEKFGLTIHSAPTAFFSGGEFEFEMQAILPSAKALRLTAYVFHEWVGLMWYALRY